MSYPQVTVEITNAPRHIEIVTHGRRIPVYPVVLRDEPRSAVAA